MERGNCVLFVFARQAKSAHLREARAGSLSLSLPVTFFLFFFFPGSVSKELQTENNNRTLQVRGARTRLRFH